MSYISVQATDITDRKLAVQEIEIQAQALGLAINEHATNGDEHGAMASDEGRIEVTWTALPAEDGSTSVMLRWRESGGPPIETEPARGTGTDLIEGLVGSDLHCRAVLSYPSKGATHALTMALFDQATSQFERATTTTSRS